jgi:hypothetical protein
MTAAEYKALEGRIQKAKATAISKGWLAQVVWADGLSNQLREYVEADAALFGTDETEEATLRALVSNLETMVNARSAPGGSGRPAGGAGKVGTSAGAPEKPRVGGVVPVVVTAPVALEVPRAASVPWGLLVGLGLAGVAVWYVLRPARG